MSGATDWKLVEQARSGDATAFAELVRRYQQPVIQFCQRMVGSLQDAEDIAQDSFVRIYRHLPRLRPKAKFSTVLFGIARNLTLNSIRDANRRGRNVTQSISRQGEAHGRLRDEALRPDRTARLQEIGDLVEQAMTTLSPEHREVLLLRELQGLDYGTIARIVRCKNGTVKSRLARAREQLRVQLIERTGGQL